MKPADVVNIIQHYRHDILNQLQVIQGYIKLDDYKKVNATMSQLLEYFYQERKLLNLNMPHVLLWFLQFNIKYENIKLTYDIDIENKNMQTADLFITDRLERILEDIQRHGRDDKLYQVEVEFKDNIDGCEICVYVDLESCDTKGVNQITLEDIDINTAASERIYSFNVSVNNEVK